MKIVSCKNCSAKYQLENNEDITTYECSSCSGELELIGSYSTLSEQNNSAVLASFRNYSNTTIVQCEDCNLKYKINSDENILDYECESCGGFLRYLTDELNEELNEFIKDRQSQEIYKKSTKISQPEVEKKQEIENSLLDSIRDIPDQFDDFFSESKLKEIANEEREDEIKEPKTARTTISNTLIRKFAKEFDMPKSNDYYILKDYLKKEFEKNIEEYYPKDEKPSKKLKHISSINKDNDNKTILIEKIKNTGIYDIAIIIGVIIFIGGIIEILTINKGTGTVTVLVGIIIFCLGLIKPNEEKQDHKSRIIREHLLSLPEEYYVFYNVKIPDSSSGINHVVVGPTGIYSILSQKYNPKVKLGNENENNNLINSKEAPQLEQYDADESSKFRYSTTKLRFGQDDKIKHKSLELGENLIKFLNENNMEYCFVEPLVGFVNNQVVVINMPLTDENLFIDELINIIKKGTIKLNQDTIDKCAVLISKHSMDCSAE